MKIFSINWFKWVLFPKTKPILSGFTVTEDNFVVETCVEYDKYWIGVRESNLKFVYSILYKRCQIIL